MCIKSTSVYGTWRMSLIQTRIKGKKVKLSRYRPGKATMDTGSFSWGGAARAWR